MLMHCVCVDVTTALKEEIDDAELDIDEENEDIKSSTSTLDVLTVVLSLWAIVITLAVVAIMSIVVRRVCCKRSSSSAASTASDAEFGNDDDDDVDVDDLSEKSSVVDFRLDPSQLDDYSKQSKRKVNGWYDSSFVSPGVRTCQTTGVASAGDNQSNIESAVDVTSVHDAAETTDAKLRSLRTQAKSLMSFILPSSKQ